MSAPRSLRRVRSLAPSSSWPSNRTEPLTSTPRRGSRPITASEVTDLPQPDSPTSPIVSPGATEKLTPSTACVAASPRREKVTARSSTSSTGVGTGPVTCSPPELRVECLAEPLTEQRETEGDDDDAQCGPHGQARRDRQEVLGGGQHRAPRG